MVLFAWWALLINLIGFTFPYSSFVFMKNGILSVFLVFSSEVFLCAALIKLGVLFDDA